MKKGRDAAPPFFARSRRRYFADSLPFSRCSFLSSTSRFVDATWAPDWLIANAPGFAAAPASANAGGIAIANKAKRLRYLMVGSIASVVEFGVNWTCSPRNKIAAKNKDILRQRQTPDDVKKRQARGLPCVAQRASQVTSWPARPDLRPFSPPSFDASWRISWAWPNQPGWLLYRQQPPKKLLRQTGRRSGRQIVSSC
jgi:hypothetical protein